MITKKDKNSLSSAGYSCSLLGVSLLPPASSVSAAVAQHLDNVDEAFIKSIEEAVGPVVNRSLKNYVSIILKNPKSSHVLSRYPKRQNPINIHFPC